MAEVVGVLASGITIVGASIKAADALLDFIGQVRNAPEEISFLQNEVTDTRLVLLNIEENTNQDQWIQAQLTVPNTPGIYGSPEHVPKGEHLMCRIDRILVLISKALRDVTKSKSCPRVTIHHSRWLLNRSKIKSLRNELHELKTSINLHFCTNIGSLAVRSVVLLNRVLLENSTRAQQGLIRDNQVDATLHDHALKLAEVATFRDVQRGLMTMVENLTQNVNTSSRGGKEGLVGTFTAIAGNKACGESRPHGYSALPDRTKISQLATNPTTIQGPTEPISQVRFGFSHFWSRGCVYDCQCTCHQRQRYKSPSFAQKVLGEMFIGFSNLPFFLQPCSDTRCRERFPFSLTVTYYLPTSFFSMMVSLMCVTTSHGDFTSCLKLRPSNPDFSLYRAVKRNDVETVRRMVEHCVSLASATFRRGWTPLHYAVTHGHVAMCKFLIAAGADPFFEDSSNEQSPLEWAWIKILGASYPPSIQREMEALFSDRTWLAQLRLPALHRIVLGLSPIPSSSSLPSYLAQHPRSINALDATGRTALSWAAQRGMSNVVQVLLAFGADPNLCTPKGHSPLQYAATAQNPECIVPLLNHGADVHQPDVEGQTALHYAAMHHDNLAYYTPLITAGALIDAQTRNAETPLSTAISQGNAAAVRYLVACGANINLQTFENRSPVFNAVETNSHEALQYLLSRGAGYKASSTEWPTIAHVAAQCANIETLRILTLFRLEIQGVESVDREGRTVMQIVEKRVADTPALGEGFVITFNGFLDSVLEVVEGPRGTNRVVEHAEGEVEEGEEVFYDTVADLAT